MKTLIFPAKYKEQVTQNESSSYHKYYKPVLDFSFALMILIAFMPLLLVVTLLVCFSVKGNPFFEQVRPGKDGEFFNILKFKTMNDKRGENGFLLSDYERLTSFGKFLRKTSLDELPQLINILRGEMSFVGPRPLLPEYLPLYNEIQNKRHSVKPGITGWAQVNGRNALSWDEKFSFDTEYVDTQSFNMDLKIIAVTVKKVIQQNGVNTNNFITMEPFKGNKQ